VRQIIVVEKLKCTSENCTATILPSTAETTGGLCMPCRRRIDEAAQEEYIRKNRITIDPFEGVTDPVDEDSGRDINDILSALAWAGTEDVLRLFALWHAQPPAWRSRLYIPPEQYARDAGWELDTGRATRSLILGCSRARVVRTLAL
jgi:hypothetical protein